MEKAINILLSILTGIFFTNAIWLALSWESVVNVLFGIMCLIGIIIAYNKV